MTLATDCSLALGTLPVAVRDGVRVLWLDAHADFDTPATQTTSFLGCMSLCGAPRRVGERARRDRPGRGASTSARAGVPATSTSPGRRR